MTGDPAPNPVSESQGGETAASLWPVISLQAAWFACFYAAFRLLAPWLHAANPPPDPGNLTPWLVNFATEYDGLEVPGLSALFALYLAGTWSLARYFPSPRWLCPNAGRIRVTSAILIVIALPAVYILLATRSWNFMPLGPRAWKIHLGLLGLALAAWLFQRWHSAQRQPARIASFWIAWGILGFALVLISPAPSAYDYGFFLGPAAKLLQGEALGSFYRQYGLGQTLLFAAMMKAKLPLTAMQAWLGVALAGWVFMYHRLALRLFAHRALAHLFLAGLLMVRVGGFRFPTFDAPQTSPLRLDLWVPLLLVWSRFGFASMATSLAFAGAYLCDDLFGALFAGLYAACLIGGYAAGRPSLRTLGLPGLLLRLAPLAAVAAFYLHVQGSPLSPAGSLYKNLQLGFLPVDPASLFWPFACIAGLSLALVASGDRPLALFLFAVAWVQFTYFFGRSHENNLMSLSGSIVLIAFLGLDALATRLRRPRVAVGAALAMLLVSGILFEESMYARVAQAHRNASAGRLVLRSEIETWADGYPDYPARFPGRDIFFVSNYDAFLYYKYHLPVRGFWTPFASWFDLEGTAAYVRNRIRAGEVAVVEGWDTPEEILGLNRSHTMRDAGLAFAYGVENGCRVLVIRPSVGAAPRPYRP
jgi:hypothetical protein